MFWKTGTKREFILKVTTSVVDPDPYVFKPPGSGSVIIFYVSRSFNQKAKKGKKT
jgi:hypothetical protein